MNCHVNYVQQGCLSILQVQLSWGDWSSQRSNPFRLHVSMKFFWTPIAIYWEVSWRIFDLLESLEYFSIPNFCVVSLVSLASSISSEVKISYFCNDFKFLLVYLAQNFFTQVNHPIFHIVWSYELYSNLFPSMLLIYWFIHNFFIVLTFLETADFDLTGQLVWPGAMLLNDYLSKNDEMLQGCFAIELGSGVGK